MKKAHLYSLFLFCLVKFGYAQNTHHISFFLSSNEQGRTVLDRFYFPGGTTVYADDATLSKETFWMPGGGYLYQTGIWGAGLRFAYGFSKNTYEKINPSEYWEVTDNQKMMLLNVRAVRVFEKAPFRLEYGLEFPVHLIGNFTQKMHYIYKPDSLNIAAETKSETQIDGGTLLGVNAYGSAEYFFLKNLCLKSSIGFGILKANLGGTYTTNFSYVFPYANYNEAFVKKYKSLSFSLPELTIGIGLRL